MHRDIGWWAFVLAIVALIVTYPLEVLAHLTAPRWKDWWAERSERSVRKRVEQLEEELREYEQKYKLLSEAEEYILMSIEVGALLGGVSVNVLATLLALAALFIPQLVKPQRWLLFGLAGVIVAACFLAVFVVFGRFTEFRIRRSPTYRDQLRKSIEKLKGRLA
ncbi:MAG: hypothetical protein WA405_00720 [Candidatus Acidiferrales bacterium]